ncbi:MAG TPA: MFS transporter [Caulobacteraceae bacterium]|nr:MFS transporter [Caulobacteraceae bacterium]
MTDRKSGGWLTIIVIYLFTILSMATVGVVASLTQDVALVLAVPQARVGLAIAMFSAPSALLAALSGGIIDRFGARRVMIFSAVSCAAGDAAALLAGSITIFNIALLLSGLGFMGIIVAAPALIVNTMRGERRVKAMSLWSTYAPTGFAAGLLLAAPFAGSPLWFMPMILHGLLMTALAGVGLLLPAVEPSPQSTASLKRRLTDFLEVFGQAPVLRLGIAVALPSAISYGVSLVAPSYLARTHHVPIGESSATVAMAKAVAMIACGLVMGQVLSRKASPLILFALLAAVGTAAQFTIFFPGSGFAVASGGLIVWLFAFGGASAVGMALLPSVIKDPTRSGAASGVVGQMTSIAAFLSPAIYFGMKVWTGYVLVCGAGMLISLLALPVWFRRSTMPASVHTTPDQV